MKLSTLIEDKYELIEMENRINSILDSGDLLDKTYEINLRAKKTEIRSAIYTIGLAISKLHQEISNISTL